MAVRKRSNSTQYALTVKFSTVSHAIPLINALHVKMVNTSSTMSVETATQRKCVRSAVMKIDVLSATLALDWTTIPAKHAETWIVSSVMKHHQLVWHASQDSFCKMVLVSHAAPIVSSAQTVIHAPNVTFKNRSLLDSLVSAKATGFLKEVFAHVVLISSTRPATVYLASSWSQAVRLVVVLINTIQTWFS